MVMATLFWHFDMELCLESYDWVAGENARIRMMREKKALFIIATSSNSDSAEL